MSFSNVITLISASLINFIFWLYIGYSHHLQQCVMTSIQSRKYKESCKTSFSTCNTIYDEDYVVNFDIKFVSTNSVVSYRDGVLVQMEYPDTSMLINPYESQSCQKLVQTFASTEIDSYFEHDCSAVMFINTTNTYNQLRFNSRWKLRRHLYSGGLEPAGYFKVTGHGKGRNRLLEKLGPFLTNLRSIEEYVFAKLVVRGILPTDARLDDRRRGRGEVTVMVVNEGEMDLLANLACSLENAGLSFRNMVVFTASGHLVPQIEALGFLGLHHSSFAYAPHHASAEYLDSTFVDMMWYKCFSVLITLRLGLNTLFQDVDLVWFKDPLPRLKQLVRNGVNGKSTEAVFSDDGQRGVRYSPFYGNSGFYYLISSPRTEYFAWTVMTLFDLLQRTGSHQNIVALRLMESMDLSGLIPVLLRSKEFPNGDAFHHNLPYMTSLLSGKEDPYNFHMCWTANKTDKIANFKSVDMWYIDFPDKCVAFRKYTTLLRLEMNGNNIDGKEENQKVSEEDDVEQDDGDNKRNEEENIEEKDAAMEK